MGSLSCSPASPETMAPRLMCRIRRRLARPSFSKSRVLGWRAVQRVIVLVNNQEDFYTMRMTRVDVADNIDIERGPLDEKAKRGYAIAEAMNAAMKAASAIY